MKQVTNFGQALFIQVPSTDYQEKATETQIPHQHGVVIPRSVLQWLTMKLHFV